MCIRDREYRDERELDILERIKTAIDPEAMLSIVAGERGRNHAGPIRWTAQGEKDSVTFIIDGKSDGSPILKDDQDKEYSFATMDCLLYTSISKANDNANDQMQGILNQANQGN